MRFKCVKCGYKIHKAEARILIDGNQWYHGNCLAEMSDEELMRVLRPKFFRKGGQTDAISAASSDTAAADRIPDGGG